MKETRESHLVKKNVIIKFKSHSSLRQDGKKSLILFNLNLKIDIL